MVQTLIRLVFAPNVKPEVKLEPSIFARPGFVYIVPEGLPLKTISELHAEISRLNAKLEHRLKGIKYWQAKAAK